MRRLSPRFDCKLKLLKAGILLKQHLLLVRLDWTTINRPV